MQPISRLKISVWTSNSTSKPQQLIEEVERVALTVLLKRLMTWSEALFSAASKTWLTELSHLTCSARVIAKMRRWKKIEHY